MVVTICHKAAMRMGGLNAPSAMRFGRCSGEGSGPMQDSSTLILITLAGGALLFALLFLMMGSHEGR